MSVETDGEVVGRSLGEPAAFAVLYDRHARLVYRYAALRVGVAAAEDVSSETFLVAFEGRAQFDAERGDVRAWLLGIATVLLRKRARLEARAWKGMFAEHVAQVLELDPLDAVAARLDASAAVRRLGRALRRLPAGERDVLLLHAWGDLDYQGIADALDVPIGTVRSRLNRARTKLRRVLDAGTTRRVEVEHGQPDAAAQSQ
ncbi:RNA polymerase sigma factor [Rathayibacter sp. PhB127]|uniref:RNA polymerase sigma factor n=1 Tax=Rathayibacter sp. PhB127 TaxID=2485176 RepID=UPI0021A83D30|nr:sigma-70 family RNA polymerase sigma factor [Rathayibacter sp. PhB127]